ncbi:MAG: hypothetical protein HY350_02040, partial [Candidatus Omnitrophica bacterium]|nr:hypothetical protein [Candidatus Omnitrophota bacterium]
RIGNDFPDASMRGKPSSVTVEKSQHLFGIGMLLDIGFWSICGTNMEAFRQVYAVQDDFGIADAAFYGYWNNHNLVAGQTDVIKASVYRKPKGGALVIIYNISREIQKPVLQIEWGRLKSKEKLSVVDAYTKEKVQVAGNSVAITVPPLNYRLLWIK